MQAPPAVNFWTALGRLVAQLLDERAHVQVVLTLKDGSIQLVAVNRTFLPSDLPKV